MKILNIIIILFIATVQLLWAQSPVVIDLTSDKDTCSAFKIDFLKTSNYYLFYIGEKRDTIIVEDAFVRTDDNDYVLEIGDIEDYGRYQYPEKNEINIIVDTARLVTKFMYGQTGLGYPVIITNISEDTLQVGATRYLGELDMILEAKDSSGNWLPIEKEIELMCFFGVYPIFLPPSEISITAVPIFEGTFETELRIKMDQTTSNVFRGRIDPKQFEVNMKAEMNELIKSLNLDD